MSGKSKNATNIKPKLKTQQLSSVSWPNVFRKCKLVLYCNMFDVNMPLVVHAADKSFVDMFGHQLHFRLCLNDLVGPSTSLTKFHGIKSSMEQGTSFSTYINFYRVDGTAVSCHITLISITGQQKQLINHTEEYLQPNSYSTEMNEEQHEYLSLPSSTLPPASSSSGSAGILGTRWAVVTLQSATSINNAKEIDIRFFQSLTNNCHHDGNGNISTSAISEEQKCQYIFNLLSSCKYVMNENELDELANQDVETFI